MFKVNHFTSFGHGLYGIILWEGIGATSSNVIRYDTNLIYNINDLYAVLSTSSIITALKFTYFFIAFNACPV